MTFAARIRRVRMKDGADVTVLRGPAKDPLSAQMAKDGAEIAAYGTPAAPLDGYFIIGMYADRTSAYAFHRPDHLPARLMPAYIGEIVRCGMVTAPECRRVFNKMADDE